MDTINVSYRDLFLNTSCYGPLTEMGAGFTPGVRFYFEYDKLEKHPQRAHDGFLPIKVKDEVKLADYVYLIIVPTEYKEQIMKIMPKNLVDRVFCLNHENLDVWQWSEKVYSFVHDMNRRSMENVLNVKYEKLPAPKK